MWRFNSIVVLVFIWLDDGSRFNKSCLHDLGVPNYHCYRVSSQLLVKFISSSFDICGIVKWYIIYYKIGFWDTKCYGLVWYMCLKTENYYLKTFVKIRVSEKVC